MSAREYFKPSWIKTVEWNNLDGMRGKIIVQDGMAFILLDDDNSLIALSERA